MTSRAALANVFPITFFRPRAVDGPAIANVLVAHPRPPWPYIVHDGLAGRPPAWYRVHQQAHSQGDPFDPLLDPSGGKGKPPDERTVRLGKTVRILHERLPTLLASPLPQEILSPQIQLHLFPSTHPHLPTVTGRISYTAALWTAPVAWGRVPVVGNVRLCILSARMSGLAPAGRSAPTPSERLVVRWRTCGNDASDNNGILDSLRRSNRAATAQAARDGTGADSDDDEFTGLFIFEFDAAGRLARHTIEHAQQNGNWEKMTRVVSVTDWLLGLARRRREEEQQGLALGYVDAEDEQSRWLDGPGRRGP